MNNDQKNGYKVTKDIKISDEIINEIELTSNLRMKRIRFGKYEYIDIRRYFNGYPMKKGIRLNQDDFEKLKKYIDKI